MKDHWQRQVKHAWDTLARENAPYYIFTAPEFLDPSKFDVTEFFESGCRDVDSILAALHVRSNPTWSVLDIGCGLGRLTRRLRELFGKTIGIDVSAEMITRARQLNCEIEFHETSGTDLKKFSNESFELVVSFIVCQHIPRGKLLFDYLTEIARILKPGGLALIQANTSLFPAFKRA